MSGDRGISDPTPSFISPPIALADIPQPSRLQLGILASGSGSNFEAIAQAIHSGELNAQIQVLVYNNPQAGAVKRAKRLGVTAELVNHRDYAQRPAFDSAVVAVLKQYNVEWVIMAGWMRIATPTLIDAFRDRLLNLHPSLLPSFPGVRAVEQALAAGVRVSGCTVHWVTEAVDSGKIIAQAAVPVLPHDTPDTLHQRIQVQEHRIYPLAIALAANRVGC